MPSESKGLYHDIYANGVVAPERICKYLASLKPGERIDRAPARKAVITQSGAVGVWKMRHIVLR